jgi:hypothetical protein
MADQGDHFQVALVAVEPSVTIKNPNVLQLDVKKIHLTVW